MSDLKTPADSFAAMDESRARKVRNDALLAEHQASHPPVRVQVIGFDMPQATPVRVQVIGFDMPLLQMALVIFKFAIASIPALILLTCLVFAVSGLLFTMMGAMGILLGSAVP